VAHPPGTAILRWILGFGILTTGVHFIHNFVEIEDYPASFIPNWVVQAGIVISWPVFTALAVSASRRYARGDVRGARPGLVAYGLWTLVSLGHFTSGNPDIPPFFYATIFTDVLAGALVLGFVVWTEKRHLSARPGA